MKKYKNYKTFQIEFYGKKYNLSIYLGNYTNNRLFVGLYNMKNIIEPFNDLTVNIPTAFLEKNEIILNVDFTEEIINKLTDLKIIELTDKTTFSGFNEYKIAKFNLEKAKKYIYIDCRGE